MSLTQELSSWFAPARLQVSPAPRPGDRAPSTAKLQLPAKDGRPLIVAFLRHCGCPFAERDFKALRAAADTNPSLHCIAVSHSTQESTQKWLEDIGGAGKVEVIVDHEREVYARWGLGVSGWLHLANPAAFWSVYQLGKKEGIWNRPTESGSRWQTSGSYAVDGNGIVMWGGPAARSDEEARFDEAVHALRTGESKL